MGNTPATTRDGARAPTDGVDQESVAKHRAGGPAGQIPTAWLYALVGLALTLRHALPGISNATGAWDACLRTLGPSGIILLLLAPGVAVGFARGSRVGFVAMAIHSVAWFGNAGWVALRAPDAASVQHLVAVAAVVIVVFGGFGAALVQAVRPMSLRALPPAPRYKIRAPSELRLGAQPLVGETVNISISGALLACANHDLRVGHERMLTLRLNNGTFESLGRVARVNGGEIGVAFVGLNIAQREYLSRLIEQGGEAELVATSQKGDGEKE